MLSLADIEGKLNKAEKKTIMAGSGWPDCSTDSCNYYERGTGTVVGVYEGNNIGECVCKSRHPGIVTFACNGMG